MNYIEKRIFRRIDAEVPVDVKVKNKTINVTSSNISCGGMFLLVDPKTLTENQQVDLSIHLPNRSKPVHLIGEVLRSEADDRHGIAVQFQGLYNDNFLEIEKFIKGRLN